MMKNNLSYKVHLYSDYNKSFIKMINQNLSNKIYILDIETPSESGINMARKIREKDIDSIIIFLTSHYELGPALLDEELMFLTFVSKYAFLPRKKHLYKVSAFFNEICRCATSERTAP